MEKAMATHSSTHVWKIPWREQPGGLQSMGLLRVGHDWATSLSLFTFMHWRRKWQSTSVFLPGEPRDGGVWWAAVYGVAQSRTRLKWLNSSSRRTRQVSQYLKYRKNGNNQWNLNPTELAIDEFDNGLLAQALRAVRFTMSPALWFWI